jgi:hypothetical protein
MPIKLSPFTHEMAATKLSSGEKKGLLLAITVIISIIKSVPERKIALSRDRSRDRTMV